MLNNFMENEMLGREVNCVRKEKEHIFQFISDRDGQLVSGREEVRSRLNEYFNNFRPK